MTAFEQYLASVRGKRAAVIGIGVSNTPLIRLLVQAGASVTACDRRVREKFDGKLDELERLGVELRLGEDYLDHLDHDLIFRTPGLRPDAPQISAAVARGSELTSEMEVFFRVCPCPIIAVTGSDGKTTTTTIISEFLKEAGYEVYLGGNIGKPLLPDTAQMSPDGVAVVELSSFQLQTMKQSPAVAVLTNLAPNHLDWHTSMEEYIAAKENIFLHQGAGDTAVFNADNAVTAGLMAKAKGNVVPFSRARELDRGVFLKDGVICRADDRGVAQVLPASEILLPGVHNVENYMAAIAAVGGLVPNDAIRAVARRFSGVEHRIELVRTLDGVRYYNDSIGTSPSRTISGLRCFEQKVILIAGGYDKHIPFDELGVEIVKRVKQLILTGATAQSIKCAVELAPDYRSGAPEITVIDDFEAAVKQARTLAVPGDVVLLSPACAAFDKFNNFMERGDTFKRIVNGF